MKRRIENAKKTAEQKEEDAKMTTGKEREKKQDKDSQQRDTQ